MSEGIRLHLGCGDVFRPGYVNVDRYDSNVADVIGDVTSLPFATASADSVEAFHLIEHFDLIHCKYLLSEWFRVLKAGGKLVLETPDLEKTYKEFVRSDSTTQERKLSWIFGIDSAGMQHKVGFTFKLACELLNECGFEGVKRCEPSAHLYEAGMRIECVKPEGAVNAAFVASLRRNLITELGTSDSYVLVPLEKHVRRVLSKRDSQGILKEEDTIALAAEMTPVNPSIALAIIKAWKESFKLQSETLDTMLPIISDMRNRDFHHRALALWIRGRKDGNLQAEFERMMRKLGEDVLGLTRANSSADETFSYLLSLEPVEIPIMDLDVVLMDARARLNAGIRMFAAEDLTGARDTLELAAKENPESPYVHWNLARLGAASELSEGLIEGHYETALSLALRPEHKRQAEGELSSCKTRGPHSVPRGPITEY